MHRFIDFTLLDKGSKNMLKKHKASYFVEILFNPREFNLFETKVILA